MITAETARLQRQIDSLNITVGALKTQTMLLAVCQFTTLLMLLFHINNGATP